MAPGGHWIPLSCERLSECTWSSEQLSERTWSYELLQLPGNKVVRKLLKHSIIIFSIYTSEPSSDVSMSDMFSSRIPLNFIRCFIFSLIHRSKLPFLSD